MPSLRPVDKNNPQLRAQLLKAIGARDLAGVRAALMRGADPNARGEKTLYGRRTVMQAAAEQLHPGILAALLDAGGKVNTAGWLSQTPLFTTMVAWIEDPKNPQALDCVRVLLSRGANPLTQARTSDVGRWVSSLELLLDAKQLGSLDSDHQALRQMLVAAKTKWKSVDLAEVVRIWAAWVGATPASSFEEAVGARQWPSRDRMPQWGQLAPALGQEHPWIAAWRQYAAITDATVESATARPAPLTPWAKALLDWGLEAIPESAGESVRQANAFRSAAQAQYLDQSLPAGPARSRPRL